MYEFDEPHIENKQGRDTPDPADKQGYEDDKEKLPPRPSASSWPETLVRVIGIILLLVGLWASIQVLLEALRLYRDPVKIEQLAAAIERGSNLDRNLAQNFSVDAAENTNVANTAILANQRPGENIRLSYFVAWIVALLILMLVAMIAFSSIRTGSELVLQDKQLKRFMQMLTGELVRRKKS